MSDRTTKDCLACGETKPLDDYHRNARGKEGRASVCKVCARERSRRWYEANQERAQEQGRRYRATEAGQEAHRRANHRYVRTEHGRATGRAKARRWYAKDPERARRIQRRAQIKATYGITEEQYEAILARGCAICGTHDGQICLDHDHATGAVRSALCAHCNRGLGCFRDNQQLLAGAVEYLDKHRAE